MGYLSYSIRKKYYVKKYKIRVLVHDTHKHTHNNNTTFIHIPT